MKPVSQGLQRRRFQTEDDHGEECTFGLVSVLLGGWTPPNSATGKHSPLGRESGALAQQSPGAE